MIRDFSCSLPMLVSDFDFPLPPDLIAQRPPERRGDSRLLCLDRASGALVHRRFEELPSLFGPGDLLVRNESRVIPARLRAFRRDAPGAIEVLLIEETAPACWWAMARPGRRLRRGDLIGFRGSDGLPTPIEAQVVDVNPAGHRQLQFRNCGDGRDWLDTIGEPPLPPYIRRVGGATASDRERYQTVFARADGSIAAPTAGLHFTPGHFLALAGRGVQVASICLHVGPGTFAPIQGERLNEHTLHEERYQIPKETADAVARARTGGARIVAVGTTSVRTLEAVARANGGVVVDGDGRTRLFIKPPDRFHVVNALLTNFHLPRSSLLMLVAAFCAPGEYRQGRDLILAAYAEAVREGYRFYSYGDAMLIL